MSTFRVTSLICLLILSHLHLAFSSHYGNMDIRSSSGGGKPSKKSAVPLLMGIVLKTSTLIPMKLMFLTFLTVTALFMSKLALGLAALTGAHGFMGKSRGQESVGEFDLSFSRMNNWRRERTS